MADGAPEPAEISVDEIAWLSISAAIAAISAVGIAIGLGIPLLSVVLENRGYSASLIGLNTAAAGVASIAAAPFATPIAERFGVVPTMLAMILIGAASLAGFHFATAFWMWFPLRVGLHFALTVLFILSEFWISVSAPPARRGLILGVYATVLSLGFAFGPWLFAQIGSAGFAPFGLAIGIILVAAIPILMAWKESPSITGKKSGSGFLRYIILVPTATGAVLVFGAVETGSFALFPVYGGRVGFSEAEAALLLSMVGLGNVLLQIPLGLLSDMIRDRRILLIGCAAVGLAGMLALPLAIHSWPLTAAVLFVWGGSVAGLYTVGLAHLGASLNGRDLASANAAFVFCYALGMLLGPQLTGISLDAIGPNGFVWSLGLFFGIYILLAGMRLVQR